MEFVADVINSLSSSKIDVVFLISGFVFLVMGTTRLKKLAIIPKWRKLLNIIGLGLILSSLFLIIGKEVASWLSSI